MGAGMIVSKCCNDSVYVKTIRGVEFFFCVDCDEPCHPMSSLTLGAEDAEIFSEIV